MQRDNIIEPGIAKLELQGLECGHISRNSGGLAKGEEAVAKLHIAVDVAKVRLQLIKEHLKFDILEHL
jgi:hypothetical protein